MRYRTSFTVAANPSTAFDYLADAVNAMWSHPKGTKLERRPSTDIDLGTEYVFTRPDMPFRSTITTYDRPSRLQFENAFDGQSPTVASWTLTPVGPGTRLTVETTTSFVGPGWMRPLVGLLTLAAWPLLMIKMWQMKRSIVRALDEQPTA
jgi:uncharacterized protein YndB with AHSA1/START domain